MKRNFRFYFVFILIVVFFISCNQTTSQQAGQKESVYDRVIKSGKIRVAYVNYVPGFIKDPKTGEFTGIFVEVLEEVGKNLGLKIEYAEEVGWGTMIEGLIADRYDLVGSPVWPTSQRGKVADFTTAIYYGGLGVFVRIDDNRFDNNLEALNDPNVKIATIDGEISNTVAQYDFPKAQKISLPQLADKSQTLLDVSQGRADVTFAEPFYIHYFIKNNPGKIKNISLERPIRIYPNTMMLKKGEIKFKSMLDIAIEELINSGFVDKILNKYEPFPGAFYRNAYPFRTSK